MTECVESSSALRFAVLWFQLYYGFRMHYCILSYELWQVRVWVAAAILLRLNNFPI